MKQFREDIQMGLFTMFIIPAEIINKTFNYLVFDNYIVATLTLAYIVDFVTALWRIKVSKTETLKSSKIDKSLWMYLGVLTVLIITNGASHTIEYFTILRNIVYGFIMMKQVLSIIENLNTIGIIDVNLFQMLKKNLKDKIDEDGNKTE